ncbi:RNA recognition motif 2-domain-containing protein [Mucor mucedo]|uniref:RNA recognition motif 2-domain-containing protein n=1 Tax=Mucor mucedo TaxID=29922 RepID=UPI00221EE6C3|nr:RNA recognition motif 2-domain-containing protein [Mucor mucedo]KAI7891547.1 RNA recognition motif 2-domain-containing protein [Mucor mucedo]
MAIIYDYDKLLLCLSLSYARENYILRILHKYVVVYLARTGVHPKAKPSVSAVSGKLSNKADASRVITKQDYRTTFMFRDIPNKYTQEMVMNLINETHKNTYDFFYLRMDFKNKCNMGYAFINFIEAKSAISLHQERGGKRCLIRISVSNCPTPQFKEKKALNKQPDYKPKLFYSVISDV